jgi:dienelactone hydrolase/pimeloyl-ACP methyl ester carboxylesterase
MVHEYYVAHIREIMETRRACIAGLKTRAQAEKYVQTVRAKIRKCFAPFPKRTPLNPIVTGRDTYRHYVLEKVVFESRPGFLVTGNLLLPKGVTVPGPAVIGLCGHSFDGKAATAYQSFVQGLAMKGFVVFIIGPISQGERRQFYPKDGGPRPSVTVPHTMMGNQMTLVGDFFGTWRVWDAIRGLDYLLSRPEVDRTQVGVTGNSGGGTLATYLSALDPRLTMAAPSCYICSFQANIENELSSDAEQNPPGILGAGLDEVDMLMFYAPRPTLILGQYDDFFDARYAQSAVKDLRKVHRLLGSQNTADVFIGPRGHGFHLENREAMYAWFMKHAGVNGVSKESGIRPVEKEALSATPKGETYRAGSRRVFDFTQETSAALARRRVKPAAEDLKTTARKLLNLPKTKGAPHFRILMRWSGGEIKLNKRSVFMVETEPGIQAYVATYGPEHPRMHPPKMRVNLYVGHMSSEEDVRSVVEVRDLTRGKKPLFVVDPRGIGQSRPETGSPGQVPFEEVKSADFFYASTGQMLGESYLGRRVFDVMRTIDFLLAEGATQVDLIGRGFGSITAAFAALLHPSAPRVNLYHYLPSYQLIIDTPHYAWPLSALPFGVLKHFDLPDVYRVLGRRLTLNKPWDARMKPLRKSSGRYIAG